MKSYLVLFCVAVAALASVGCVRPVQEASCSVDRDCLFDEACVEGSCRVCVPGVLCERDTPTTPDMSATAPEDLTESPDPPDMLSSVPGTCGDCAGACDVRGECVELTALAVGGAHACVVDQRDRVWCWGSNARGQLGVSDEVSAATPALATSKPEFEREGVVEVSAGGLHTCLATGRDAANETLWCWGDHASGQLGHPDAPSQSSAPRRVALTLERGGGAPRPTLALGQAHSCAFVREENPSAEKAQCWGANEGGQSTAGISKTPECEFAPNGACKVPRMSLLGERKAQSVLVDMGAGAGSTCVITREDTRSFVECFGDELGEGIDDILVQTRNYPARGGFPRVDDSDELVPCRIDVGNGFACVLAASSCGAGVTSSNNQVLCFSKNANKPLGAGRDEGMSATDPVAVVDEGGRALTGVLEVAVGRAHACATDGRGVWCWGENAEGELGTARVGSSPLAAVRVDAPFEDVRALAAGAGFTCALDASVGLWCWGRNELGQLGRGAYSSAGEASAPARVEFFRPE